MMTTRCVFLLAIGAMFGCADLEATGSAAAHTELAAGSCSTVTMGDPAGGFSALAGDPIELTATAVCSSGTPEFEYWFKFVGDANWQVITPGGALVPGTSGNILANYVPGTSSFAPSTAGDICFSAVARAIGSTVTFEGRSSSVCGTVTGGAPQPAGEVLLLGGGNAVSSNANLIRTAPDNVFTTGSTALSWTLPLHAGDAITGGSIAMTGDGIVDATISVELISVVDGATTLVSGTVTNVASSPISVVPFTVAAPVPLGPTDRAVIRVVASASGLSTGSVAVGYVP